MAERQIRVYADVMGIFRFLSIPVPGFTVGAFLKQIQREFNNIYNLALPLAIEDFRVERVIEEPVELDAQACDAFKDRDVLLILPKPHWVRCVADTPWELLSVSRNLYENKVGVLLKLLGRQCNPAVLRSCLLRAGGSPSKAAALCVALKSSHLGTPRPLSFVHKPGRSAVAATK
eukprot:gnl/Chilomastix_cuspidata/3544.p1 GENE.gnl/Chilomastix_cuspidata/3544~~gnl/Chilomastix_cuspidata/3544.p1  ORF type:complete len:175 (+),score=36.62 gnl/Chilomastix_cuspidata/3544:80-604(+)